MSGPLKPVTEIHTEARYLPLYALFSLARGLCAYGVSFLFTMVYGYAMARVAGAERVMLPVLDILQSIPVLGFLPGFVLGLVHLFPHRNLGLEIASVLMIFYAARLTRRRWPFAALAATATMSLAGMLFMSGAWIVFWSGMLGFCNAFMLILTLALPPLIAKPEDVSRLAAAMIAIGYLLAFLVPIAGGALWDATRLATMAFAPLLVFGVVAIALSATLRFDAGPPVSGADTGR